MYEPSSAEVLGQVADMSRDEFMKAIKIADKGFRKYSTSTTFAERGVQLRKWNDLILENVDDCTSLCAAWLIYSGQNPFTGERKDTCRGKGRNCLLRFLHSVVQRRSTPRIRRCHPLVSPQHNRVHTQTTRGGLWHHYAVELPSRYDHPKDRPGIRRGMFRRHQATQ